MISLVVGVAALGFAFVKIGAQPLPIMVSRAFLYFLAAAALSLGKKSREKNFYDSGITRIPANSGGVSGSNSFGGNAENKIEEIFRETPTVKKALAGFDDDQNSDSAARKILRIPGWQTQPKESFQFFRKSTGEKGVARRMDYR